MKQRKLIKFVKKINNLVHKNMNDIEKIIVSEGFLKKIQPVEEYISFKEHEDEEGNITYTLFGAPVLLSQMIVGEKCILETKDGQYIILE